jgi:hypothetical protein
LKSHPGLGVPNDAEQLVTNGKNWASRVCHDPVRCREGKVRCRARYAFVLSSSKNDEVRFSQLGEFQNLLGGVPLHDLIFGIAPQLGLGRNSLA